MKRIVYIHHGDSQSGAARSLSFLISGLDKSLYEPIVVCFFRDINTKMLFENAGAQVEFIDNAQPFHGSTVSKIGLKLIGKNFVYLLPSILSYYRILSKLKPDIVHLNSTCIFVAGIASKILNRKTPVVCHIREPLLSGWLGAIISYGCSLCVDQYISIDKYDATTVRDKKKKVEVVYNFVDTTIYKPFKDNLFRTELKLSREDFVVLYLARIAPSNGALELLNFLSKNSGKISGFKFVFVGDNAADKSDYAQEVRKLARGLDNVFLLKFRNDVPRLIASCDCIICPFITPHFARTIIEAAAMRKISIASDIPGPQELVRHMETGFLYTDINDIVNYLELVQRNDQLLSSMGEKAFEFAMEKFTAEKNVLKVQEIYYKILNRRG